MSKLPDPGLVDQAVVDRLREHLAGWRAANPDWTEAQQLEVFSPIRLWERAHGDGPTYRALMVEVGHLVPAEPGTGPRTVREFFGCDESGPATEEDL